MSIIKDDDRIVYRAFDESSSTTYELEVSSGIYWSRLRKLSISCEGKEETVALNVELTLEIKEVLMKAYMNLSKEDFKDLFGRLDMDEIRKFTFCTIAYIGGQCNEDYRAYVDDFGNLLLITNYVYHYNHGCSSLYKKPAGCDWFKSELNEFARGLFKNIEEYKTFISTLNEDTLKKYFEASYIPSSSK